MAEAVKKATRHGYNEGLVELAKEHEDIICLDADLGHATGSLVFRNAFPDRYIETGIAEQDLIGIAAGLARTGFVPFANSFAVFTAGRAFEIIRNAVCYSNVNVKIVGSHCGITPAGDGGTHQCIEDIAAMRALPNMTVLSPCDFNQAKLMAKISSIPETMPGMIMGRVMSKNTRTRPAPRSRAASSQLLSMPASRAFTCMKM